MKVKPEELKELIELVESYHKGDYVPIIIDLTKAIYQLHYVEEGSVSEIDLHNTCFGLFQLIESFYGAHQHRVNS